jgi:hypothetical protein
VSKRASVSPAQGRDLLMPTSPVKPSSRKAVLPQHRKAAQQRTPRQEKVTFYVTDSALKALEVARVELLTKHNIKVNRSEIVEQAIQGVTADVPALAKALGDRM